MKIETFLKKNRKVLMVFALVAMLLAVATLSTQTKPLGIYVPGWEIYNQIGAMKFDNGIKSSAAEFTSPRDISAPYWKVDPDAPNYNVPTIMVQTSDISHVDFMGKQISNSEYAKTITVTRGNHTYYLDYHIYMFKITMRTVADRVQTATVAAFSVPIWEHETSWGAQGHDITGDYNWGLTGQQWTGGAYVKFVINPWTGQADPNRPAPTNYSLTNAWAGVMNSYIFLKEQGQVANQWGDMPTPDAAAPMFVRGGLDTGAQVPMFMDDGTYGTAAPTVQWDPSSTLDARISSNVVLYLPVQEEAGAYLTRDWMGNVYGLTPCDVFVGYTLRVDVLQAHDYVLNTAYNPPKLENPTDFFSWVLSWWDNPANQAIISLILIAIFALVVLWVFMKYRKGKTA